jgi:crotonobetainyl-CoA:carnitine CoA-transferase CaiB-like acyl-CoA transferase
LLDPSPHAPLHGIRLFDLSAMCPGTMARLGLDHATLAPANPRLVTASITGGAGRPCADGRVYDAVIQAVRDELSALTAAQALCAALVARARTGHGARLELAMLDAQVRHNAARVEIDHGDVGTVRLARSAAPFGAAAGPSPKPAPHVGEHGREVLAELGCEAARIDALLAA